MPNLYPTVAPPDVTEVIAITEATSYPTESWVFDFAAEEFAIIPPGRVRPIINNAFAAYLEWARKAIITVRYRYPVYGFLYGSELESLLGEGLPQAIADNELQRMVRDCLLADPRTADVRDLAVDWTMADAPVVSCTLVSVWGNTAAISQEIPNV